MSNSDESRSTPITRPSEPSEPATARSVSGVAVADDETRAPEEENESHLDGDPREPSEMQPPTSESY
jgi:hypothetical protein